VRCSVRGDWIPALVFVAVTAAVAAVGQEEAAAAVPALLAACSVRADAALRRIEGRE
jgi:hypothetical protein